MKANIKKIIEFRKSKSISVNRFAELLGISTRTVYNWENKKSNPGKTDLMAIAHLLDIKLDDISDYKEARFLYRKPGLQKGDTLKESVNYLKHIINDMQCGGHAKLVPILHSYDDVYRLNRENSRLKKRVSKLNFILDSVDSAVYVKNSKQIVTYVNQKFMNMLSEKFIEEEIIGHKFFDILPINEIKPIISLEKEAFNGNSIYNKSIKFPFCNQAKIYIVSIVPIFSKNRVNEIVITLTPSHVE